MRRDVLYIYMELSSEELNALKKLKKTPISPTLLNLPRSYGTYMVHIHACDQGIGCVGLQKQPDERDRPISYWQHSPLDAECTYDTSHRKGSVDIGAVLWLHAWLEGTCFTIQTDHDAVRWIPSLVGTIGKHARCRIWFPNLSLTSFIMSEWSIRPQTGLTSTHSCGRMQSNRRDCHFVPLLTECWKEPTHQTPRRHQRIWWYWH